MLNKYVMDWKKISTLIISIVGSAGVVTAILTWDDRYIKPDDLNNVKNQIINEMRAEVAKNRDIMIQNLEREELDMEFDIETRKQEGKPIPQYWTAKLREIQLTLDELKVDND